MFSNKTLSKSQQQEKQAASPALHMPFLVKGQFTVQALALNPIYSPDLQN